VVHLFYYSASGLCSHAPSWVPCIDGGVTAMTQYSFVDILDHHDESTDGCSDSWPSSVLPSDRDRQAILALSLVASGSPTTVRHLLRHYAPQDVLQSAADILASGDLDNHSRSVLEKIRAAPPDMLLSEAEKQSTLAHRLGAIVLTYQDHTYPANLQEALESPLILFVRGTLDEERDPLSVALVGTREASGEGLARARKIARLFVERGIVVVSGLARGIDTAAHLATLDAGGRTLAVVGCGLDRTYPSENVALADAIADGGAVVSQFPFGSPPTQAHFPMRNKTMALLSRATIVVEAGLTSGAKMQANYALRVKMPKRHVFLMDSLINGQNEHEWAHEFLGRGAQRLRDIGDVMQILPGHQHTAPSDGQMPLFL